MPAWYYVKAPPCGATERWQMGMGGYHERAGRPVRRLEIPTGRDVLIFGFGEPLSVQSAFHSTTPTLLRSFAGGFNCHPHIVGHEGTQQCIEVSLPAWATSCLFYGAYTEWNHAVIDLRDLWGRGIEQLTEQLSEAGTWENRFQLARSFLAGKLASMYHGIRPELRWAWERMEQSQGRLSMRALARELSWSDRHFATLFRNQLGSLPKAAAQRIRFANALQALQSSDEMTLSDIAARFGYSDQSHFTRDIRRFSGCTPAAIKAGRFPDLLGMPAEILDV